MEFAALANAVTCTLLLPQRSITDYTSFVCKRHLPPQEGDCPCSRCSEQDLPTRIQLLWFASTFFCSKRRQQGNMAQYNTNVPSFYRVEACLVGIHPSFLRNKTCEMCWEHAITAHCNSHRRDSLAEPLVSFGVASPTQERDIVMPQEARLQAGPSQKRVKDFSPM